MAAFLAQLRARGLDIRAAEGRLVVPPISAISEATRATIRANRPAILHELEAEAAVHHAITRAVLKGSDLAKFVCAIRLGALNLCALCSNYRFASSAHAIGRCRRFTTEAWPFVPFACNGFSASAIPAAPEFLPRPNGSPLLDPTSAGGPR